MPGSLAFATGTDDLQVSLGQAVVTDAFTVAVAVADVTLPASGVHNLLRDAGDVLSLYVNAAGQISWWNGATGHHTTSVVCASGASGIAAVTKAAGSAVPRLHWIPLPSGAALHGDSDAGASPDVVPTTPFDLGGTGIVMDVLAVGVRKAVLTDAELEALTSWTEFAAAFAVADGEAWELDGTAPFNGSGTSTQVALSGTAHSTEEPAGFWGAFVSIFDGTTWTDCPLHVYDGSAWTQAAGLEVA